MLRLIFALVDIMLHRRGPDSLPSSPFLFRFLVTVMLATAFMALIVGGFTLRTAGVALLVIGFGFWFVWAVLRLFERQGRFRQTMSAVLGTDVIFTILIIPLIPFDQAPTSAEQAIAPASVVVLALRVWSIDVLAFVLSRAVERPYLLMLAVSIAYFFLMLILQGTLLPRPA